MNNKLTHIIGLITFLLFIYSCEREILWNIDSEINFLVVDALITSENKIQVISVQGFNGEINSDPVPLSGVEIALIGRADTILFIESDNQRGIYYSARSFRATAGLLYELNLKYRSFYDTAYAEMAPIDKLQQLDTVRQGNLYKIKYTHSRVPSMMDIYYDWSSNPAYCQQNNTCQAWETYYSLKTIDIQKEFAPDKERILFPTQTIIIRRKYSLSDRHQDFIRSLLIETQWRGGLFDIEQGNVPTNFRYGTKGWFGVCMVQGDTTFFE